MPLRASLLHQKVNNYEIKALLGQGGMGAVYLAEHPMIDRKVAVKVLKRELAEDQSLVQRFFNEARAANAIRHPGIVEVLDVGVLPDGLPYLIMELLAGETLAQRIARVGRLPAGEAVAIACQAATAVAAAHAKGIVHRDLKPDNLFLARDEQTGGARVKVLDFGIAKLRRELTGASLQTRTGALLGTPPYMSPEQCKGGSNDIDHRTDVYALGIILYEMLTGAPPFVADGFGEMLLLHMTEPPRPLRAVDPQIAPDLEAAVLTALGKRREDRFATMAALAAALAAHADRTVAPPPGAAAGHVATISSSAGGTRPLPTPESDRTTRPMLSEGRASTTFSAATGATAAPEAVRPRRSRAVLGGAIVAAAVGAAAVVWVMGRPAPLAPTPRPAPTPAAPAPVALPPVAPAPSAPPLPAPVDEPVPAEVAPVAPPAAAATPPTKKPPAKRGAVAAHREPSAVRGDTKAEARSPSGTLSPPPAAPAAAAVAPVPTPPVAPVPTPPATPAPPAPKRMKRW